MRRYDMLFVETHHMCLFLYPKKTAVMLSSVEAWWAGLYTRHSTSWMTVSSYIPIVILRNEGSSSAYLSPNKCFTPFIMTKFLESRRNLQNVYANYK